MTSVSNSFQSLLAYQIVAAMGAGICEAVTIMVIDEYSHFS